MKKKLAIVLSLAIVMVMLFSGCTNAETIVHLEKLIAYHDNEIGDVTLTPMTEEGTTLPCGINVVRFVFERPAVVLKEGTVTIYRYDDDSVYREFVVTQGDDSYDNINIFNDPESNGSVFEFGLGGTFEAGEKYYFEVSEGLFGVDGEGYENIISPAYGGKDTWVAEIAPYGIDGFDGTLKEIGNTRTFNVVVGGDAVKVEVEEVDDDVVTIEPEVLTESGVVTLTVNNYGNSIVRFSFLDENGELLQKLESGVYIEEKIEEVE